MRNAFRLPTVRFTSTALAPPYVPIARRLTAGRPTAYKLRQAPYSNRRITPYFMSSAETKSDTQERASKRRRISTPSATQKAMTVAADDNEAPALPRIELTKTEQCLRSLLLDVAKYIQQKRAESAEDSPSESLILRFTGGWVRDKLLGVGSQDIDVGISDMTGYKFGLEMQEYLAIPGNIEEYARMASDGVKLDRAVGSLHKVVANPEKSKHLETCKTKVFNLEVDLVNLRKETYTEQSRNPQMEFGTPLEDALRRDATVNALFYNLHTSSVEDFTGKGLQDMEGGLIRTPLAPYQTFKDDPLRVLRLIRFASRLGYQIDVETQEAMKNEDIKLALRAKISQERVGIELEKMLRGPDPLGALQCIDRLRLYDTIFVNHHDDVHVDASNWRRAYASVNSILIDEYNDVDIPLPQKTTLRRILVCDAEGEFYSWMIAALSPWTAAPPDPSLKKSSRPALVARDSLRCGNKLVKVLTASAQYHQMVADIKTSFLNNDLGSTEADVRWKISQLLRTLGSDWRLCILQAMLLQIMGGTDAADVCRDYEKLLLYIEEQDLLKVDSLRPFVDGRAVSEGLGLGRGPWMGRAMEMIVEWQVRNPGKEDAQEAISSVEQRKEELGLKQSRS